MLEFELSGISTALEDIRLKAALEVGGLSTVFRLNRALEAIGLSIVLEDVRLKRPLEVGGLSTELSLLNFSNSRDIILILCTLGPDRENPIKQNESLFREWWKYMI